MTIGICGMGKMGAAMAERLIDCGDAVAVWNRTAARTEPLAALGAAALATPAALAQSCDIVISMVLNDTAIAALYEGPDGLTAVDLDGTLVIEMSTIGTGTTQRIAAAVEAAGGRFVECPVAGTVMPARNGQLLGMAGGTDDAVAAARPTLDKLCRRVEHVGPAGAAAVMKIAVNLPMMVYAEALGEALALTERAGIDRAIAAGLLVDSSGAAKAADLFMPDIVRALGEDFEEDVMFEVSGVDKDMQLVLDFGAAQGLDLPVCKATKACFEAAIAEGWQDRSFPLLAAWRARKSATR